MDKDHEGMNRNCDEFSNPIALAWELRLAILDFNIHVLFFLGKGIGIKTLHTHIDTYIYMYVKWGLVQYMKSDPWKCPHFLS